MFVALFDSLRNATQFTWIVVLISMLVLSCILTIYCTWYCKHETSSYVLDPQKNRRYGKPEREFYV
ncbi:hypothetical protein M3Y97_00961800 [Aphelenchoides bicaudatus]|nr:hypothetical protein M3Y97_00961800 [Aphelenchoides bicaudatus]